MLSLRLVHNGGGGILDAMNRGWCLVIGSSDIIKLQVGVAALEDFFGGSFQVSSLDFHDKNRRFDLH
jgi:hypothetical protein